MKMLLTLVLSLTTLGAFAKAKPTAQVFKIDPKVTTIDWLGKKVTGQHNGKISIKSGSLTVNGDLITAGEIVVDMNSIVCEDITDKEYNTKFIGHMKSNDFFDTEKFPEAKLVIKNSKKTDKGLEVQGDLTMRGKTAPVTFLATVKAGSDYKASTTLVLDRTQWDLKYGSGKFFQGLGDKMIHDEFTLNIDLTAKK
ncbi:MAG: YceI family protein [Bacteriovoracaceae bacterium]